uniref:Uncharacterized protein n=1 Tax=Geladintestivirus 1 TaxID=3233133 RepID=A0AAU8MK65_9CAUD
MITNEQLNIDKLICIDESGMPKPATIRNLMDADIRELYRRDETKDKTKYLQECIIIYYMGDPKSPARQSGLSDKEALKMAIEQAGLPTRYIPDKLVLKLIKKYYAQNITEAGLVVENLQQGIHNIGLAIKMLNKLLNDKLNTQMTVEDATQVITIIDQLNKKAGDLPTIIKKLEEAKQNLMYEKETEIGRGGQTVLSSMDAEAYQNNYYT